MLSKCQGNCHCILNIVLAERMTEARKRAGLRQVELAVALGNRYDHTVISAVEHGRSSLRLDGLTAAARELEVSTDYLLGLTDDPTPAARLAARITELEDATAPAGNDDGRARVFPFARPGVKPVPFVQDAALAAGAGANADDEYILGYVPFRDDWLAQHDLNPEQCRVIEVIGDSMEPTLESRAVVLVDFERTIRRQHKIFAVRTVDGHVVKRLRRDEDGWWLVSDHEDKRRYPTMPWPREAVVRGQIMWTGKTL